MMSRNSSAIFFDSYINSWFDDVNNYISGIISLISNSLLIFASSKIKSYTPSVRFSMYSMAILRLVFSLSIALACPIILYSVKVTTLYIIKNSTYVSNSLGDIFLALFIAFIVMSCNGPAVQYLQVAFLLSSSSRKEVTVTTSLIQISVVVVSLVLIFFGYIPPSYEIHLSRLLLDSIEKYGDTAFLIVTVRVRHLSTNESDTFQYLSLICTLFILIIMFISIIVVVYCHFYIRRQMALRYFVSTKSRRAQEQLNLVLLLQFLLPFVTIHIPFYIIVILPIFGFTARYLASRALFLFCWCPAINPILVIVMVKNVREELMVRFSGLHGGSKANTRTTSHLHSKSRVVVVSL